MPNENAAPAGAKKIINTGSISFQFFSFIAMLLAVLLVMLNVFPYVSTRDAVYQEKEKAMESQASTLASALTGLEQPDEENVAEVLRLLDMQGFERVTIANVDGYAVYDSDGAGGEEVEPDLLTALEGKTVFRSVFRDGSFLSSYAIPIASARDITGAVFLRENDAERGQILRELKLQIRVLSIVIALAALVMAALYGTTVLGKLKQLSNAIRIVSGGNYKYRMEVQGKDELAELGREFNALTAYLEDTERQRRRFVSDASHELKTPLASIRLLSDSIVQTENMDVETMREFVSDIGNEAERLQHMTEDLLSLSRMDDDIKIVPEPVDVKKSVLDAMALLRPVAAEKQVALHSDLDDGCIVLATKDNMHHIVFNLLENAVKYNYPEGSVTASLHAADGNVQLTVADTGVGIPEDERYNIFGRFYRIDKARSREAGGSGLGLSIVHDAVKAHGGTIQVGANEPHGSVFIVTFPQYTG
ncbi:MAG: HAMP domain-containing histidine kinase [Oscillospiraceae bacterium]|nr:HAMP domain-containing histidine kinase [Oscillospiraceae bacterium]